VALVLEVLGAIAQRSVAVEQGAST